MNFLRSRQYCISNWPFLITREPGPKITCTMDSLLSIPESWFPRYNAIDIREIDPLRAEREIVVPEENPALADLDQFVRVHDLCFHVAMTHLRIGISCWNCEQRNANQSSSHGYAMIIAG